MILNKIEQVHVLHDPWVCTIISMRVLHDPWVCTIILHGPWVGTIITMRVRPYVASYKNVVNGSCKLLSVDFTLKYDSKKHM